MTDNPDVVKSLEKDINYHELLKLVNRTKD